MIEKNMIALVEKQRGFFGDAYSLLLYRRSTDKSVDVVKEIIMQDIPDGSVVPADLCPIYISHEGVVRLMDSLWEAGIRPSHTPTTQTGIIDAQKAHIADLRAIVFNRIGVEEAR